MMKFFGTAAFVMLLTLANAQQEAPPSIIMQSAAQTLTFGAYSATWFTFVDQTGLPKIRVILQVSGVDMTNWGDQGDQGYWMGIGFGAQNMTNADIVMCQLFFTGLTSSDQFFCSSYYSTGYGNPTPDANNIISNNATVNTYYTLNGVQYGTFKTIFDRPLSTIVETDYNFLMKTTVNAIWAHGQVLSSAISPHTPTKRGTFRMYIPSFQSAMSLAALSGVAALTLVSSLLI